MSTRRSRRWCFTINNPTSLDSPEHWPYRYVVWQEEEGTSHTPHLQGFVVWHRSRSLQQCRGDNSRAHWEIARGTLEQNVKYCTKDEGRLDGPWTRGSKPNPGKRNDLTDVTDMIITGKKMREVMLAYPVQFVKFHTGLYALQTEIRVSPRSAPSIFVLHGPSGVGKTKLVSEVFPNAFWKPKGKWWDGYDGEDVVIIDEYYGWLSLDLLLRLLDRYPLLVEKKGGTLRMLATVFVFTSNLPPSDWYPKVSPLRMDALYRRLREYGNIQKWCPISKKFISDN